MRNEELRSLLSFRQPGDSDGVDYFKPSGFDEAKHYLIMATADYAVWLDSDGELDWETKLKLDARLSEEVGIEKMNAVYNRAAILQAGKFQF